MKKASRSTAKPDTRLRKREIRTKGIIKYLPIEGGFYGIIGNDGQRYDPLNLPPHFRSDGLRVQFVAVISDRAVSFHMWGQIIKLVSIEKLP